MGKEVRGCCAKGRTRTTEGVAKVSVISSSSSQPPWLSAAEARAKSEGVLGETGVAGAKNELFCGVVPEEGYPTKVAGEGGP